jgi:hypothetical protein
VTLKVLHGDSRQVIGTRPRRSVLDVIIAWHMLCYDRHVVILVLGQEQCGGETGHTGSVTGSGLAT